MHKLFTFLTFLVSALLLGQNQQIRIVDSIVDSKITDKDPGLMVGIVKDGAIIYKKAKGLASLQHQVPVTEHTRSNIASTAKQFTALMVLDLVQQNKLRLEDDIRKYIPSVFPKVETYI